MTNNPANTIQLDKQQLADSLGAMGVPHDGGLVDKLEQFIALLIKWNKVYNLTAIRDPKLMVTHHLLDSLAVMPYLNGTKVLDVGSGAGIPGIPLAIFNPNISFTLLDSNRKKTRFIAQAAIELGLKNVDVVTGRVEAYQSDARYDTVMCRAFASIEKILTLTGKHCAETGRFVLMKGVVPEEELKLLPEGIELKQVIELNVPGLEAERHLIILSQSGSTN